MVATSALADLLPGQVLVAPRQEATAASRSLAREAGFATIRTLPRSGLLVLATPAEETVEQAVARLSTLAWVRYAQPNYVYRIPTPPHAPVRSTPPTGDVTARFTPNDPLFGRQWHLSLVGAQAAWDLERGDPSVIIALIDTGVAYRNGTNVARAVDLAGVSFVAPHDWIDGDAYPDDMNGHGTHVCGTLVQATNNGIGVAGLAHGCALMPLRVLDADGNGSTADIAEAVYWAVDNGADVINMSLGSVSSSLAEEEAVEAAESAGVVVCAAAGNDGAQRLDYPAAFETVLAVGAVRTTKARASYSNYALGLDLVAPGGDTSLDENLDGQPDGVYQNAFEADQGDTSLDNNLYYYFDGTSMATPHVAASAALVLSRGGIGTPRAASVRSILTTTAEDLGAVGWDRIYGHGLVRPDRALASIAAAGRTISGSVTLGGAGLAGVTVRAGGLSTVTDSSGDYTLSGLPAGTLTVTPGYGSYVFAPAARSVSATGASTGIDFAAGVTIRNPLSSGVAIVTVPGTPLAGHTGATELLGTGSSALYSYLPATESYTAIATPVAGQAYFARVGTGGAAVVAPATSTVAVSVPVGYSLLGNPSATVSMPFSGVRVRAGGTDYSLTQAVNLGLVRSYGWLWDTATASYKLLHPSIAGSLHSVPPWAGFFFEARDAVTMLLPAGTSALAAEARATSWPGLSLRVRAEDGAEGQAWLGWPSDGSEAEAAAPAPPETGSSSPRVRIAAAGALVLERAVAAEGYPIVVETGGRPAGSLLTLTVEGLETLPRAWSPVLSDEHGANAVALRAQPVLALRAPADGAPLRFRLVVEQRGQGLRVRLGTAESLRGRLEATYEVTTQSEVTAEVRNAAGRVVARLGPYSVASGAHALRWDGRSDLGTTAPSGRYTLWLRATSPRGERAEATAAFAR